jgi:hypothetical protein
MKLGQEKPVPDKVHVRIKKCVIAYSSRDSAPKMIGDKHDTEALGFNPWGLER